jgi:hypothetical protein
MKTVLEKVLQLEAELEGLQRRAEPMLSDEEQAEALKQDLQAFIARVEAGEVKEPDPAATMDPEARALCDFVMDEIERRAQAQAEALRRWLPPRRFPDGHYH